MTFGGACCGNSKTIARHELEERVLNCIPAAFYSLDIFDRISQTMIAHEVTKLKSVPSRRIRSRRSSQKSNRRRRA